MVCPDGSDRTLADLARLQLRRFLVISEIFRRPKRKLSDGEIEKTSIDGCGEPSAVIGRTLFESLLIASAGIGVQIGGELALMAQARDMTQRT